MVCASALTSTPARPGSTRVKDSSQQPHGPLPSHAPLPLHRLFATRGIMTTTPGSLRHEFTQQVHDNFACITQCRQAMLPHVRLRAWS